MSMLVATATLFGCGRLGFSTGADDSEDVDGDVDAETPAPDAGIRALEMTLAVVAGVTSLDAEVCLTRSAMVRTVVTTAPFEAGWTAESRGVRRFSAARDVVGVRADGGRRRVRGVSPRRGRRRHRVQRLRLQRGRGDLRGARGRGCLGARAHCGVGDLQCWRWPHAALLHITGRRATTAIRARRCRCNLLAWFGRGRRRQRRQHRPLADALDAAARARQWDAGSDK